MFTEEQILEAQSKVKSGKDFPGLIKTFKAMGIVTYEHWVAESANVFYDASGEGLKITYSKPLIIVKDESSAEDLRIALKIHQAGQTDYPTFCLHSAEAGVEKWVTDLDKMTVTYLDKKGAELVIENIPGI